jgi:3-mercaptopyruvate sulfurtransferase SseA
MLLKAGFEQVSVLRGGMKSWNKEGHPVLRNEILGSATTVAGFRNAQSFKT